MPALDIAIAALADGFRRLAEAMERNAQRETDVALADIRRKLDTIINKENQIMAALDDLETRVTEVQGVVASAIELLNGLHQALLDAIASGDMSRVVAVNQQLADQAQALAEAVAANPLPGA